MAGFLIETLFKQMHHADFACSSGKRRLIPDSRANFSSCPEIKPIIRTRWEIPVLHAPRLANTPGQPLKTDCASCAQGLAQSVSCCRAAYHISDQISTFNTGAPRINRLWEHRSPNQFNLRQNRYRCYKIKRILVAPVWFPIRVLTC